jgi:biotin carboxylase
MTEKKLILLASAFSYRAAAFEAAAAKLGICIVRGEDVPPPMFGRTAAELSLDYRDIPQAVERVETYAHSNSVGALIGLDDSGTQISAEVSRRLGLPYNDPDASAAAHDKAIMRQKFLAGGVPSPRFQRFTLAEDPAAIASQLSYPCVLKPTNMAGSRGVMRADTPEEFLQRFVRLKKLLHENKCSEYLVEDFIPGEEVALEGLLDDGRLHVLALFDKPDPLDGPFFEETIYTTPSRLPEAAQEEIAGVAARAAAALGLRFGPVHAELRLSPEGPVMVEMAARSIGGHCSRTLRFGTDSSLEELILRRAFGLEFDLDRERSAGGVMMIPIPEAGFLQAVEGVEAAEQVPLIESVEIEIPLHHRVVPLPEGNSYLGFIFARGETPAAVEAALRAAHSRLHFTIMPEIPLLSGQGGIQLN